MLLELGKDLPHLVVVVLQEVVVLLRGQPIHLLVLPSFLLDVLRETILFLLLVGGGLTAHSDDFVDDLLLLPLLIACQVTLFCTVQGLEVSLHVLIVLPGVLLKLLVFVVLTVEALPKHVQYLVAKGLREYACLLRSV